MWQSEYSNAMRIRRIMIREQFIIEIKVLFGNILAPLRSSCVRASMCAKPDSPGFRLTLSRFWIVRGKVVNRGNYIQVCAGQKILIILPIQKGNANFTLQNLMKEIDDLTRALVTKTTNFVEWSHRTKESSIISPTHNRALMEGGHCDRPRTKPYRFRRSSGGLSEDETKELLVTKLGPLDGCRSKIGEDFYASRVWDDSFKAKLVFENSNSAFTATILLSKKETDKFEIVRKCPLDGPGVFVTDNVYVCQNYFDKPQDFEKDAQ
jgi:hypothetical protein